MYKFGKVGDGGGAGSADAFKMLSIVSLTFFQKNLAVHDVQSVEGFVVFVLYHLRIYQNTEYYGDLFPFFFFFRKKMLSSSGV